MNSYLNYLVEANFSLIVFLAVYALLLGKETDFRHQRLFLLLGVVASLIFPLLHISYLQPLLPSLSRLIPTYILGEITIGGQGVRSSLHSFQENINARYLVEILYFTGVLFFLVRFIMQLRQVLAKMSSAAIYTVGKCRVVESDEHTHTFSFFNYIFLGQSGSLSIDEKNKIIRHETVHASQFHSCDLLLINLVGIFFWFNPILRLYKKTFIQLHEFEADARTVNNRDANAYCSLLAKVALQSADFPLANHFNSSLTLKRITMMRTIKKKIKPWKMLVAAGIIPIIFFIVACQEQMATEGQQAKKGGLAEQSTPVDGVYTIVDETAVPAGGITEFYNYVAKNLRYPAEARMQGIEGKVFIEFIVDTNGDINVTGISGIGGGCDLEAMRVVQSSPKWIPGKNDGVPVKQKMVLPINFSLDGSDYQDPAKASDGAMDETVVVGHNVK